MSSATAPVPGSAKKPRRTRPTASKDGTLPFPIPAPGEAALVGRGNWDTYLMLDEAVARRGIRVRYDHGTIEIMRISRLHERLKSRLRSFVEAFCDHLGLAYDSIGSATQQRTGEKAGEPDESYTFGPNESDQPDLVIEVALTSGGIDKIAFWASLGVTELWLWQNDALHAFVLRGDHYVPVTESHFLPGFPFALVRDLINVRPSSIGLAEFRRRLAARET